jgi:hypothetical protein
LIAAAFGPHPGADSAGIAQAMSAVCVSRPWFSPVGISEK